MLLSPAKLGLPLDRPIDLARLEICELVIPQVESFRSAIGERLERRAIFVRWYDREGAWGIGECSCRPDPFFSGEFVDGAIQVLRDFVWPLLADCGTLGQLAAALGRVRGWPFATSTVLDAALDLERRQGRSDFLDEWSHGKTAQIPVGISLGLFDSATEAVDRVGRAVDDGYRRVKLKIAPSMDRRTVEAIRSRYPDLYLGFDANGTFCAESFALLVSLAELTPRVLEQPFAPGRLDLCQRIKQQAPELRICLDESLHDPGMVVAAHRLGALDEVNIKPGRLGGAAATLQVLDYCRRHDLPAWVGGMFETGVGRWANLRVAACLPAATAHDLSPSSRYFARDIVSAPIEMTPGGHIDLASDAPVEIDESAFAELTVRRLELVS